MSKQFFGGAGGWGWGIFPEGGWHFRGAIFCGAIFPGFFFQGHFSGDPYIESYEYIKYVIYFILYRMYQNPICG